MKRSHPLSVDRKRYRKVRWFFIKVLLHTLWWDVVLNRPLLRVLRKPPLPRWRLVARRFRALAAEMGGVLIKLGQFLSIRVDILPDAVVEELAGLQDEVDPEPLEAILARIEEDFGRSAEKVFPWISPEPLGAASLAQAHRVKLPCGREAVAKVLRPGIEALVETDLAAISLAFGWLRFYPRVSRRVDMDWLTEEFVEVTRKELDFANEARNAERLESDLAGLPYVYIPKIHRSHCRPHVLVMENVGHIKIADLQGLEQAGISPAQVADRLYTLYMHQVFESFFVHVDPHPGNLFVKPLPLAHEKERGVKEFLPGDPVPRHPDRPFQIVFVDFGMAVTIPERLRSSLREYAIGFGTHDAERIVQSLVSAGTLLPGADLKRLEEAHETLFSRLWGVRSGQLQEMAWEEMKFFLREYRDIVYEAPFQFQADMLFVVRALGILSGMAARLDPQFDVWAKTIPYAERYAREELRKSPGKILEDFIRRWNDVAEIPEELNRALKQARKGRLTVQADFALEARQPFQRLEAALLRLARAVTGGFLLVSGVLLHVHSTGDGSTFSLVLIFLSFLAFLGSVKRF